MTTCVISRKNGDLTNEFWIASVNREFDEQFFNVLRFDKIREKSESFELSIPKVVKIPPIEQLQLHSIVEDIFCVLLSSALGSGRFLNIFLFFKFDTFISKIMFKSSSFSFIEIAPFDKKTKKACLLLNDKKYILSMRLETPEVIKSV